MHDDSFMSTSQGLNVASVFNIQFIRDTSNGFTYTLVEITDKTETKAQLAYIDFAHAEKDEVYTTCTAKTDLDFNA